MPATGVDGRAWVRRGIRPEPRAKRPASTPRRIARAIRTGSSALLMAVALTALEVLVAFLQAYVFTMLTCMYLNDALHPGH